MGNGGLGEGIEPVIHSMSAVDTGNGVIKVTAEIKNTGTVAGTCTVTSDGTYRVQGDDTFYVLNLNPSSQDLTLEPNETKTIELTSRPMGSYLAQGTGSFFFVCFGGWRASNLPVWNLQLVQNRIQRTSSGSGYWRHTGSIGIRSNDKQYDRKRTIADGSNMERKYKIRCIHL